MVQHIKTSGGAKEDPPVAQREEGGGALRGATGRRTASLEEYNGLAELKEAGLLKRGCTMPSDCSCRAGWP